MQTDLTKNAIFLIFSIAEKINISMCKPFIESLKKCEIMQDVYNFIQSEITNFYNESLQREFIDNIEFRNLVITALQTNNDNNDIDYLFLLKCFAENNLQVDFCKIMVDKLNDNQNYFYLPNVDLFKKIVENDTYNELNQLFINLTKMQSYYCSED